MKRFSAKLHAERASVAAAVCLAVAGCNSTSQQSSVALEDSIQPQQTKMMALAPAARRQTSDVPPIAALPGSLGSVISVKTRNYSDGLRQDIAMQGGAIRTITNGMTVLVRTTRQSTLDESVPLFKPTEGAIRSEIGAQFPRIPMQVVDRQSSNNYGSYGLALGRAAGDVHCLYMWQWIDASHLPQSTDLTGPASIRVRICRADMTFDAMAAALDHLVLGRESGPAIPDRVATNDEARVIVTPAAVDVTVATEEIDPPPSDTPRPKRVRRHHHAKPKHAEVAAASRDAVSDGSGDEPRYMSPVAPPAARSQPVTNTAVSAMPVDLPPQAYLGPKAGPQSSSRPN